MSLLVPIDVTHAHSRKAALANLIEFFAAGGALSWTEWTGLTEDERGVVREAKGLFDAAARAGAQRAEPGSLARAEPGERLRMPTGSLASRAFARAAALTAERPPDMAAVVGPGADGADAPGT